MKKFKLSVIKATIFFSLSIFAAFTFVQSIYAIPPCIELSQCVWTGGQSNETVTLENLSTWTKYSDGNKVAPWEAPYGFGATLDAVQANSTDAYIVSSPIDIGTKEIVNIYDSSSGRAPLVRQADSAGDLSTAPWVAMSHNDAATRLNKRFIQYRYNFGSEFWGVESVYLVYATVSYRGTVLNSSGLAASGWDICDNTGNCNMAMWQSDAEGGNYYMVYTYQPGQSLTKTFTASAPGYVSKTITVTAGTSAIFSIGGGGGYEGVYNVTLEKNNPASTTTTNTGTSQTKNTTTVVKPVETFGGAGAPAAPPITELKIADKKYLNTEKYQYGEGMPIVFSGKTIPNGIVRLYFQSDPFEDTTTADTDGVWTYELTKDIGAGDHTLQIAVTDPTTNLTSEKSEPVSFAYTVGEKNVDNNLEVGTPSPTKDYLWWYVGLGTSVLLLLGGLGFYIWNKKKSKKTSSVKQQSAEPDEDQKSKE